MSRKREKPYSFNSFPRHTAKRHRPFIPDPEPPTKNDDRRPAPPPALHILGLSPQSSVLDLKSRFEIYGSVSRIRIGRDGVGRITFRSLDSAQAAVSASLDPSFGITIDSKPVQVMWANDPLCQWREGVALGEGKKDNGSPSSSMLLKPELPLRRHGRGNKLASAIVNPRSSSSSSSVLEVPFKGREIVAYDDIV